MLRFPWLVVLFIAAVAVGFDTLAAEKDAASDQHTVLGIADARFTLNRKSTFLLGISYYAGLGAPEDFVRRDLDNIQQHGLNWLRVFVTWGPFEHDDSAVDIHGEAREPQFGRLKWLVAECDRRGLVVDLTFARGKIGPPKKPGGHLPDLAAHQRAVEVIVSAVKEHRNWYIDLANEHDVRDERYVPIDQIKTLREEVRRLDSGRLVTASFGGHDLSEEEIREAIFTAGLDFLAPHRPRDSDSPAQTLAQTANCIAIMKRIGHVVPVSYQEPFRRGYTKWDPAAKDFLTDLRGAIAGGAAGWCFHNGSQQGAAENRPRRSFDLSGKCLFEQLDEEERKVVEGAKAALEH